MHLRFHRRDGTQPQLAGASRAVLQHLAGAGPLTIGELADHLDRAQSVASEIVDQLERLARDRDVLSRELLTAAMTHVTPAERAAVLAGMRSLLRTHPQEAT